MSLSARERQALETIWDGLTRSDPELTSMLATFGRLTAAEAMPATDCGPPRQRPRRLGLSEGVLRLLIWLALAAAMIALIFVSLALIDRGKRSCGASYAVMCSQEYQMPGALPAGRGAAASDSGSR